MRKILFVLITLWLTIPAIHAQKVGLVLSGGGAKGLTHIGIIRALEENNIPIDLLQVPLWGPSSAPYMLWDILPMIWWNC